MWHTRCGWHFGALARTSYTLLTENGLAECATQRCARKRCAEAFEAAGEQPPVVAATRGTEEKALPASAAHEEGE